MLINIITRYYFIPIIKMYLRRTFEIECYKLYSFIPIVNIIIGIPTYYLVYG